MTARETFLAGKVALVTGSSSGAGVEIARALARAGGRVAVHYRQNAAGAAGTVRAIAGEGGERERVPAQAAPGKGGAAPADRAGLSGGGGEGRQHRRPGRRSG